MLSCSDGETCRLWKVDPTRSSVEDSKVYGGEYGKRRDNCVASLALFSEQGKALEYTYLTSVGTDEKTTAWSCLTGYHFEFKEVEGVHTDWILRVVASGRKVTTVSDDCTGTMWSASDMKNKGYGYEKRLPKAQKSNKGLELGSL